MTSLWFVVLVTVAVSMGRVNANCALAQYRLAAKHPLLLDDNEYSDVRRFKRVDASGYINMVAGENVTLVCPGRYNYMSGGNTKPVEMVTASCVNNYNFLIDRVTVDISQVACFSESYVDLHLGAQNACGPNTVIIEVGFTIPKYPNNFLKMYEVCWDHSSLSPVSAHHLVIPGYQALIYATRSAYLYREVDPTQAYVVNTQTQSFTTQLDSESAKKYITSSHYLALMTLIPPADFVHSNQQLSTFFYINTVPVWRNFASTYWTSLETSIRSLANTDGNLNVDTGALGIHELPNNAGVLKPIYLYASNDQRYMAVPAYLVKSVTNSAHEQVVFVQVAHRGEIARSAMGSVCAEDVCAQLRWLPWRHVPAEERPSITCCRADDPVLRRHLPDAFARGLAPSTGLLVGQAEYYD